jgi:hypothetical protein
MVRPSKKTIWALVAAALVLAPAARAAEEKPYGFVSGPGKVRLVELYTSQARSSCPPAEAWLSALRESPDLWKEIVPVSFHVSHWDKRGWKDRLAAPEFGARFVGWLARWRSSTPYAPTVALDGTEWSGWAKEETVPAAPATSSGTLTVKKVSENEYRVLYAPEADAPGPWVANGVLLGFGVVTRVEGGENVGKTLKQDFVAIRFDRRAMESTRDGYRATLRLPAKGEAASLAKEGLGLAVWIGRGDDLLPVQAAGTFLPGYRKKK